jgi:hypothetical protein
MMCSVKYKIIMNSRIAPTVSILGMLKMRRQPRRQDYDCYYDDSNTMIDDPPITEPPHMPQDSISISLVGRECTLIRRCRLK